MTMEEDEKHRGPLGMVAEFAITVVVALGLAMVLRTFVFEVYEVPTGSMLETIQEGDRLVGEKITYHFDAPSEATS